MPDTLHLPRPRPADDDAARAWSTATASRCRWRRSRISANRSAHEAFHRAAPAAGLDRDAEGRQDVTPRGDPPGSFKVLDDKTLAIADRPGNNRLDTLHNLLANPNIGLLFMIPGMNETTRVNGTARLSTDPQLLASMAVQGKAPRSAIVIEVREAYMHCPKAFMRRLDPAAQIDRSVFPSLVMIGDQVEPTSTRRRGGHSARNYRDGLRRSNRPRLALSRAMSDVPT